jgi:hypothetical protein
MVKGEEEVVMEEVMVEVMAPQALGPDWAPRHKGLEMHKDLLVVVMGMGVRKDL